MSSFNEREKAFIEQTMHDGLENVMTGLGTGKDKNAYNEWTRSGRNRDHESLIVRYRECWVAQKVCEILPQDMTREWRRFKTPEAKMADKKFRIRQLFQDAYKWARVFGTAAIILDVKGSGPAHTPLRLDNLKPGCIRSLQVVDRTRLMPTGTIEMNPMDPEYGYPQHYMLGGSTVSIHRTRILRFEGTALTRYENWKNQWYSDSVLLPLMTTIDNFHVAAQSASALVHEANADVVTVEGLQNLLTHPQGEAAVMKRFRMMKTMKSNHNVILLDSTEEYSTKTIALSGVKDLIWEYLRIIAAACGVPATRFLSASPDGMNATGESDLNNYIDTLKGEQISVFDPRLEVIDKLLSAHFGLPEIEYEWICPFPESAIQKEERRNLLADSMQKLVTGGVIKPETAIAIMEAEHTFHVESLGAPPPPPPKPTGGTK
ncbi:MAG: DUF1073 domain-containing protein [Bacteroidales bacterium]